MSFFFLKNIFPSYKVSLELVADLVQGSFIEELLEIPMEKMNLEKENISGTKAAEKNDCYLCSLFFL